jgi:hypothetical protein
MASASTRDPLRPLEIDADAAAAAGQEVERGSRWKHRRHALGAIDAHHLRAHVGEHHGAEGRRPDALEREDPDAGKGSRHATSGVGGGAERDRAGGGTEDTPPQSPPTRPGIDQAASTAAATASGVICRMQARSWLQWTGWPHGEQGSAVNRFRFSEYPLTEGWV